MEELTLRRQCETRLAALKAERTDWDGYCREVADWFHPRRGRFNRSDKKRASNRSSQIINNASLMARRIFRAGMHAGLTSPAREWFRLETEDPELLEWSPVKAWVHHVENRMRSAFARSNLYSALPGLYEELGLFGTGAMAALDDPRGWRRYHTFSFGEYYLALGSDLTVDTCYREFALSVAQVVRLWGVKQVSVRVREAWHRQQYDQAVDLVHACEPNPDLRAGQRADLKRWRSIYFEAGAPDERRVLSERGYDSLPIFAPRWDVVSTDTYGASPAMDALGDTRQLQQQEKRKAQAIDRIVTPPLLAPSSMRSALITTLPGGITYSDEMVSGRGEVRPLYTVGDISALVGDMSLVEERIWRAMYADLFLALLRNQGDSPQKTATEVLEIAGERFVALGDVLERMFSELLTPLVDDMFARLLLGGGIQPPPEEVQGSELKIRFVSPLAMAQQYQGLAAVDQLLTRATAAAQLDPQVMDKVDLDQAMDEISSMLGAPPGIVRSDDAVAAIREARARAEAERAAAELAPGLARAAKDLGQAGGPA